MAEQHDHDTAPSTSNIENGPVTAPVGDTPAAEPTAGGTFATARQTLADNVAKGREQATDKARLYAEDGKARATSALGQLSTMLNDAAAQVDEKIGEQYGQYARQAADRVQGLSSSIDAKTVDDLVADVRELVKKSPAVAVGVAAGIGFVVARLLSSGLDHRDA
ncbi:MULTISPECIES: hypothetical protein [Sphingomonas]|jgi:ElaB/YqjD/DUF883 family membrane-anchored ribosome-binding protein|uniref:DUF883 domain-containing protein n=1 Tax=Sphingomonas ginsenosidimutans TaxID=862134 RepID=A0A2A4HW45_9SPHN|nr:MULTISPECIES: hypothetical protein [Sphingomonas]MBY0301455.1 hypothetical protein [Sphingomonas ginsenosidimutans]MEE2917196.1 hypothetical protein [Pseudomonadota bacterium]PCG08251.1 hypothetical protein COA17_14425 [Sphingomonas ginsenosidimutans]